jgi:hypothetical protein
MTWDSANSDIVVNVYGDGARPATRNLTMICIASTGATFDATGEVRSYGGPGELDVDTDLSAALIAFAKQFFAQPVHPPTLKISMVSAYTAFETDLALAVAYDPDIFAFVTDDRTKANLAEFATACVTVDRIGVIQCGDAEIYAGTTGNAIEVLKAANNGRVFGVYHDDDLVAADLCWLAYKLGLSPDDGSTTFDKVALTGVDLAEGASGPLTAAEYAAIKADNGNSIITFGGIAVARSGLLGNGDFIDAAISRMWAKIRMKEALTARALLLSAQNRKFPYDETGIAELRGVGLEVLQRGEPPRMQPSAAHFVQGSTFVNAPDLTKISAAVKATRVLPAFTAGGVLSGSIETVTWNVYLGA